MTDEERAILTQAEAILRRARVGIIELQDDEDAPVQVMHEAKFGNTGRTLPDAVAAYVHQWSAEIEEVERGEEEP